MARKVFRSEIVARREAKYEKGAKNREFKSDEISVKYLFLQMLY